MARVRLSLRVRVRVRARARAKARARVRVRVRVRGRARVHLAVPAGGLGDLQLRLAHAPPLGARLAGRVAHQQHARVHLQSLLQPRLQLHRPRRVAGEHLVRIGLGSGLGQA